jgi:hypothetical protein
LVQVHLREFVVRMKEFESTDNTGLFAEEEEAKRIAAQQAEAERIAAVRPDALPHWPSLCPNSNNLPLRLPACAASQVPGLLPPNQAILDDGMADEL